MTGDHSRGRGLTVHAVPRLLATGATALTAAGVHHASPVLTAVGCVGLVASAAGEYFTRRVFPHSTVRRYADHVAATTSTSDADDALVKEQRFHVGMRHVAGERGKRPHLTLFYPTAVAAPSRDDERPPLLPFHDERYAAGFARYGRAPAFTARHHMKMRMHMARNAPLAPAAAADFGSAEHPVVLLSHGLAGHQHMYAAFAADLAAAGAIVLSLQHTDGSACFALEPPADDPSAASHAAQAEVPYRTMPDYGKGEYWAIRKEQLLSRRVPEVRHVMRFVAAELRDVLEVRRVADDDGRVPMAMIGHSFGAATVLTAAALQHGAHPMVAAAHLDEGWDELRRRVKLTAVVSLDTWTEPLQTWLLDCLQDPAVSKGRDDGEGQPLPPLLLQDSEHWDRWTSNKANELQIMNAWAAGGGVAERSVKERSDHFTLSVLSDLVNLRAMRRKYTDVASDRRQCAEWASSTLAFVRRHHSVEP